MERVSMIGIDLAKNSFQAHGARGGRFGCVPQEAESGEDIRFCGLTAALHGSDGGVCVDRRMGLVTIGAVTL